MLCFLRRKTFAERFKEHQKSSSPIHNHCKISGHKVTINNFTIIGREDQNLTRAIKEALFVRVNDPSLNRNIGKYHLSHIWDEVLHSTSELKLKKLTQWLFHLPSTPTLGNSIILQAITSAKHHYNGGNNISHKAITSAKNKQNKTKKVAITSATWQEHLPINQNMATTSAILAITSAKTK